MIEPIAMSEQQDTPALIEAPGRPGIAPTWTSSAKDIVGCSLGPARLWFTAGFGIINEVYFPRVDIPQIRDLGFIIGDGKGFWVEVKRLGNYQVKLSAPGVPAADIVHEQERFRLRLRITPDPERDVLLIETTLEGDAELGLYVLLAPHIGATGDDNVAYVGRYRGRRVLWAERRPFGLALAAVDAEQRDAFGAASAGYVGFSDGWQDFNQNGGLTWSNDFAGPGNVALTAALPRYATLALGFGGTKEAAATLAISSLTQPFDAALLRQISDWQAWYAVANVRNPVLWEVPEHLRDRFLVSTMVLRAHIDKSYPGAMVASLSIPWGSSSDARGGYHLVWPRDLVECAGALLALGAEDEARNTLRYLIATQQDDGHWEQNQWLGGSSYWQGIQVDETAMPVLLAAALAERDALGGTQVTDMIERALQFIICTGPTTQQDRWEENAGVNCFTLATAIAALVAGADFLGMRARRLVLAVADFWNVSIERWLAARGGPLAERLGVSGYYVRVAPPGIISDEAALSEQVPVRNRRNGLSLPANEQVSMDFLHFVRSGLRSPTDPLILDTIKVVDALLKVDTPTGPSWHRYLEDGYGEAEDGRAFTGFGLGRCWPLLTGERGHYEVAAGHDPLPYLDAIAAMMSAGGLIPEQVWDREAIPERYLFPGRPTGSAMPLAWAHAEFIKLAMSRHVKRPIDRPTAAWERYRGRRPHAKRMFWFQHAQITVFPEGSRIVVALPQPAQVHWGIDGWQQAADSDTVDAGLGLHTADLHVEHLAAGQQVDFTWRWRGTSEWTEQDFHLTAVPAEPNSRPHR
jgi:glucoamylase